MGWLVRLLVLVVVLGVAVKHGLLELLRGQVVEAAQTTAATTTTGDLTTYLSLSAWYEAMASLPPPFGAMGKVMLTMVLIGLAFGILAAIVGGIMRMLRWFLDILA